jgi:hypothetical protein
VSVWALTVNVLMHDGRASKRRRENVNRSIGNAVLFKLDTKLAVKCFSF